MNTLKVKNEFNDYGDLSIYRWFFLLTCDLLVGPKIQLGGFFMKVKEEDLRRELLKAINGEDSWNRVRPS